jgi:hypothetical protein
VDVVYGRPLSSIEFPKTLFVKKLDCNLYLVSTSLNLKVILRSLLLLQVYTAQRVEYVAGNFFGNENGAPTRTLLSFLITSLGGNYEDLVCFAPTITLKWSDLLTHFEKVMRALVTVGFSVVLVLLDGHKTNVKFLSALGNGQLEICLDNPFQTGSRLFTMFDTVHIFKNFYHNFERHRYRP